METNKNLAKGLYVSNVMVIYDKLSGLKFMVNKYYEEEIIAIGMRLANLVTFANLFRGKKELVAALADLNRLHMNVTKDLAAERDKFEGNTVEASDIISSYQYVFGQISLLRSILNAIIRNINIIEKESQFSEEDKKAIDESKGGEDTSYLG